jgi:hypothetical protein
MKLTHCSAARSDFSISPLAAPADVVRDGLSYGFGRSADEHGDRLGRLPSIANSTASDRTRPRSEPAVGLSMVTSAGILATAKPSPSRSQMVPGVARDVPSRVLTTEWCAVVESEDGYAAGNGTHPSGDARPGLC